MVDRASEEGPLHHGFGERLEEDREVCEFGILLRFGEGGDGLVVNGGGVDHACTDREWLSLLRQRWREVLQRDAFIQPWEHVVQLGNIERSRVSKVGDFEALECYQKIWG